MIIVNERKFGMSGEKNDIQPLSTRLATLPTDRSWCILQYARIPYLDMLQNWLMLKLNEEEGQQFIFQQDGAAPHWHEKVRRYLNEHLPRRWIGRAADTDNIFWISQCAISSCGVL